MTDHRVRLGVARLPRMEAAGLLAARLLLAAIFVHEGISKIAGRSQAVAYAQAFGVPGSIVPAAILLEIGGGLAIAAGLLTRAAAVALAMFCIATAVVFHARFGDVNQLLHFEKNLAIAGGFLALACAGGGRYALDQALRRRGGA